MIQLKVTDIKDVTAQFSEVAGRHLPFAVTKAVNNLAFLIREQEIATMARVFDRPKPQTLRNVRVIKAFTPSRIAKQGFGNLHARIEFDQIFSGEEYMVAEVEGGTRKMKPSEQRLGRFYVPGMGAKMDKFGNMQGGQVTQILSFLKKFEETGYHMNRMKYDRASLGLGVQEENRRRSRHSTDYFMVTKSGQGLKPGVYMRTEKRNGFTSTGAKRVRGQGKAMQRGGGSMIVARGAVPVMLFTSKAPSYKARFPFFKVAQDVTNNNYQRLLEEAIAYALRTAR